MAVKSMELLEANLASLAYSKLFPDIITTGHTPYVVTGIVLAFQDVSPTGVQAIVNRLNAYGKPQDGTAEIPGLEKCLIFHGQQGVSAFPFAVGERDKVPLDIQLDIWRDSSDAGRYSYISGGPLHLEIESWGAGLELNRHLTMYR